MHDEIFLSSRDDYIWARNELLERFPEAQISDFKHRHNFSIEFDIPEGQYMSALTDLGLIFNSLHFFNMKRECEEVFCHRLNNTKNNSSMSV